MKIRQVVIVSMLALLCLGAFFIAGCAKPEEEANVIKIGVAGPMQFIHGQHHMLGAQMAADEINAAGGIKIGDDSYRIELVKIDTNELLSVDDAASAVEKALAQNNIDLLVGTIRTEAAVAIQELMMDHQKIYITCGASFKQMADKVAEDYDRYKYWFRITPMNGEMLAKASLLLMQHVGQSLKEDYGVENLKVAVVCEEAAAGDALAAAAEQAIPAFGFELAGVWRPSPPVSYTHLIEDPEMATLNRENMHIDVVESSGRTRTFQRPVVVAVVVAWAALIIFIIVLTQVSQDPDVLPDDMDRNIYLGDTFSLQHVPASTIRVHSNVPLRVEDSGLAVLDAVGREQSFIQYPYRHPNLYDAGEALIIAPRNETEITVLLPDLTMHEISVEAIIHGGDYRCLLYTSRCV